MIKKFLGVTGVVFMALFCMAQTIVNEAVSTGAGNNQMVFYQLKCGEKTIASNTDWHFAVSVRPSVFPNNTLQGTTIRINEALGVKVYQIPGFTADSFNVVVDTAGYHQWQQLHDSDSLLDLGALNSGLNINLFNYGWGAYNGPPNHDVAGTKIYLYELPDGSTGKFIVDQLDRDTAWELKFAAIDNANLQNVHIGKSAYSGKNFVYLNLQTATVTDKEPLSADWDVLFTRYAATDVTPNVISNEVGVLLNKGVTAAACGNVSQTITTPTTPYTSDMNTIGWNWKYFDLQNNVFVAYDSLVYFVKDRNGQSFKAFFTQYNGTTGIISFTAEQDCNVAVGEIVDMNVRIFPNPANGSLNILTEEVSDISVFDMSGKLLAENHSAETMHVINTTEFAAGYYLLKVSNKSGAAFKKFCVFH